MRKGRKLTDVGIYHIILRGNSRFIIFYDEEDRIEFCSRVAKYSQKTNVAIYAYVLMDNHIHMLAKSDNLSTFISLTLISFVRWYNKKYKCSGNLCSSPYYSVPKNSINKIKECIIYILRNPLEAGIAKNVKDYKWSSADLYFMDNKFRGSIIPVNTSFVEALFESESDFHEQLQRSDIKEWDIKEDKEPHYQIPYSDLTKHLDVLLNGRSLKEVDMKELKAIARSLTFITGATYIQIANMLHVSYAFVRNTRRKAPLGSFGTGLISSEL